VLDESYPSLANWDDFLALYDISNTANYTFARNGNVYTDDRLQNTGGNQDWYEGAFAEPDAVLRGRLILFFFFQSLKCICFFP